MFIQEYRANKFFMYTHNFLLKVKYIFEVLYTSQRHKEHSLMLRAYDNSLTCSTYLLTFLHIEMKIQTFLAKQILETITMNS